MVESEPFTFGIGAHFKNQLRVALDLSILGLFKGIGDIELRLANLGVFESCFCPSFLFGRGSSI